MQCMCLFVSGLIDYPNKWAKFLILSALCLSLYLLFFVFAFCFLSFLDGTTAIFEAFL